MFVYPVRRSKLLYPVWSILPVIAALFFGVNASQAADQCNRRGRYHLSYDGNFPMCISAHPGATCEATFGKCRRQRPDVQAPVSGLATGAWKDQAAGGWTLHLLHAIRLQRPRCIYAAGVRYRGQQARLCHLEIFGDRRLSNAVCACLSEQTRLRQRTDRPPATNQLFAGT